MEAGVLGGDDMGAEGALQGGAVGWVVGEEREEVVGADVLLEEGLGSRGGGEIALVGVAVGEGGVLRWEVVSL